MKVVVHIAITEREAIYIDGQFWDEGDSFNWPYIIEELAAMGQFQWVHWDWENKPIDRWVSDNGDWPATLTEVSDINAKKLERRPSGSRGGRHEGVPRFKCGTRQKIG